MKIKVQKDNELYYVIVDGKPLMKAFYRKDGKWKCIHMGVEKNVEDIPDYYENIFKELKIQDRKEKLEKLLST